MEVLLSGLGIPESPRWHDGRLWFANWIENQIVAVDVDGTVETTPAPVKRLMGWSIDWMPDGSLVTTGDNLLRQQADGSFVVHAEQDGNELVVDSRGNAYLNGADFDFAGGEEFKPGYIKLVTPDGVVREVADDIQFPNGMVITPDEKTLVISESFAGRLTAFDIAADGGLSNRRVFARGPRSGRDLHRRRGRDLGVHRRLGRRPGGRGRRDPRARSSWTSTGRRSRWRSAALTAVRSSSSRPSGTRTSRSPTTSTG